MPHRALEQLNHKAITVADLAFPPREGGYRKGHETREQILTAALQILVEEGYRAMSMRRIATACGMQLGNLTYHFSSREDLVQALLDAVISAYEVELDPIAHNPDAAPDERLGAYCQLVLEDIRTRKTTRVFPELWALANHDQFVSDRVQELYSRARAPLVDIVAAMRPDLAEQDRDDLALFVSASMEGMTVFAGHEKRFEPQMPSLEAIAIQAFVTVIRDYQPNAAARSNATSALHHVDR